MQSKIRSLASDTIVYGISSVVARFLTFLLTPLYTNYLTASEIGDVTSIYVMIAFVNVVYSFGLEPAFMRFWEQGDDVSNQRVFSVSVVSVAAIGVVITALTILFASPISTSWFLQLKGNGASYVAIAAFVPLFDALVLIPFARLRMQKRPRAFAILRFVSVAVTVVLNLVFVVGMGMRIEGALYAGLIGSAVTLVFFIPSLTGVFRSVLSDVSASLKLLREMLRFGIPTLPSSFSAIMVQVADRPILLMLTSSAMVGMYQTNFRLAIPMMMFVQVFEYAWKPFYLGHRNDPEARQLFARVFTLFTIVCGAVFLVTTLFMPYLVQMPFIGGRFINPLYWSGLDIIPVVMFAYFFNGVFINLAAGFHIEKRTSFFPLATGVAAIVSVAATWFLVPHYGIMGAAWAKVAAYVAGAAILYVSLLRVYPVPYDLLRVGATIVITAAVYSAVNMMPNDPTTQLAACLAALPIYLLLLFVTRILGTSTLRTLLRMVKR